MRRCAWLMAHHSYESRSHYRARHRVGFGECAQDDHVGVRAQPRDEGGGEAGGSRAVGSGGTAERRCDHIWYGPVRCVTACPPKVSSIKNGARSKRWRSRRCALVDVGLIDNEDALELGCEQCERLERHERRRRVVGRRDEDHLKVVSIRSPASNHAITSHYGHAITGSR